MAEIQAGTRFAAIAPSVDVERRSALVNSTALDYTIEDIAAAVGGDVDLSAYLTIANAATTYQAKPVRSATGTRGISANIANNTVVSVGVANSTGGSSYGRTNLQVQSGFTWSAGGTVQYTFRNSLLNSTSNIYLTIQAGQTDQMFSVVSFYQQDGELEILVKNIGSVNLPEFYTIGVNWSIMV